MDFFRLQEPDSLEAAPASPDYVPGPKELEQAPFSLDYVPRPKYLEYLAPSDEEIPIEDQPYAITDSPIALSLGYIADSDPEEDSEDGPVDYPADGGDSDDDDSSDDDKEEEEASKEEEDIIWLRPTLLLHLLLTMSPLLRRQNRLRPMKERHASCLATPALPSSPLLIVPHPYGSPNHVRTPLGFRAAMGRLRASSPSTHHLLHPSPPLPPPPSSLHLPPHVPTSLPLP
ncbi:hypothetical protein Tco_1536423, partial [Tanacetum coccineum]